MSLPIVSLELRFDDDAIAVRQMARKIAGLLGFDGKDQTRIATAVSEIARNAYTYATGGRVDFLLQGRSVPQLFEIRVSDRGPGIADLRQVLDSGYRSSTGTGNGITGARRLMDQFHIDSAPTGTVVLLKKILPRSAPVVTLDGVRTIGETVVRGSPLGLVDEVRQQNRELLQTLEELRARQDELLRLNGELEDTNRGVVALYAELDEKADHLRRADELKSRFLSNMSHEFRTPLNAIRALTHVLLQKIDGPLTPEQEAQIGYIRKGADELAELVEDLLDLAKVEAGKIVIRPAEFEVATLFSSLRGMLRPLLVNDAVSLTFDASSDLPPLHTDESKVSQILRNLLSNALKFTERGEVRVSASRAPDDDAVVFSVADTGIGIAREDQERIFQEFGQLENPVQHRVRGTGLGLPLSRKLAELLGGRLTVTSALGVGSTFVARIPIVYAESGAKPSVLAPAGLPDPRRVPVLVIEDSPEERLVYEKFLKGSSFQVVPTATVRQARQVLSALRPAAIVLDILLRGEDAWSLLAELKEQEATRDIPIIVVTAVDDPHKGLALGADAYIVKPVERRRLLDELRRLTASNAIRRVLVVDDDEVSRYLIRRLLDDLPCVITEAATGDEGLQRARQDPPDAIVLDLVMPGLSGEELLTRLKAEPATSGIPVVMITSKILEDDERCRLEALALTIVSKSAEREEASAQIRAAFARVGLVTG
jgi:signal transduction histidine kinase/CheY-like chemotaxis protein